MKKIPFYIIVVCFLSLVSCSRHRNVDSMSAAEMKSFEEKTIEVNREVVRRLQDTIQCFAKKQHWDMQKTGTGLWYNITRKGTSDTIMSGDIVQIAYTVSLLNGKMCYTSDSLGLKTFKVGQGGVESGLEEAILKMCLGDSARLLIPPHLAHGLIGDQNKIPKLAVLNYTVVIKNHQQN
jgi:FKBP-type peptidyl-prolyl cis-trans isomerase FkpA